MTIRHDRSASSIVTTCSRCPDVWYSFAFTIEDARERGQLHDERVHDASPRDASSARRQADYRARLAEHS
jgi:hypothetical protein